MKVPFNFSVGSQHFHAGEYSLKTLLPNEIALRNQAGQVLATIGTNAVESTETQKSVKLVFNEYAGQYFLSQIWNAGNNVGRELSKSPGEIEMASKHAPGQQIALRTVAHR